MFIGRPRAGIQNPVWISEPIDARVKRDDARSEALAGWVITPSSGRRHQRRSCTIDQNQITFNWPRLTWPRLASRHADPWSRKMSATSSHGRAMAAARYLAERRTEAVTGIRQHTAEAHIDRHYAINLRQSDLRLCQPELQLAPTATDRHI
jgi:hypothetical protein